MAVGTSVRPELEKGWIVEVAAARSGEPIEAVVAVGGTAPVIRATGLKLTDGQDVPMAYSTGAARVELTAKVIEARTGEAELQLPEKARRIQRREFARIFVEIPMMLLIQRGTTLDLSAGGSAIRMGSAIAEGSELPFLLVCDAELQITGVAKLIGSDQHRRSQFRHRLRFDQLRPSDRDDLAAWVFRQQMPR